MKKICFVRHAKAEKIEVDDFDRRLTKEGVKESELTAKSLIEDGFSCDIIVSSDTDRTFQTAKIIGDFLNFKKREIQTEHRLYQGTRIETYYSLIRSFPDNFESAIVVGHNTTLGEVVNDMLPEFDQWMTTAAAVCLSFSVDHWEQIKSGKAKLEFYKFNKNKSKIGAVEKRFVRKIENKLVTGIRDTVENYGNSIMLSDREQMFSKCEKAVRGILESSCMITIRDIKDLYDKDRNA